MRKIKHEKHILPRAWFSKGLTGGRSFADRDGICVMDKILMGSVLGFGHCGTGLYSHRLMTKMTKGCELICMDVTGINHIVIDIFAFQT